MGMIATERSCDRCYGDGKANDGSKCWYCHGTGRDLTDLGRELVKFIDEHFVLTPKAEGL